MTVTATTRRSPVYTGNGTTTAFPFVYKVFANTNIQVLVTSVAGVISTAVLGSDYTVALNADQTVAPGGTVNYVVAPATGVQLVIIGALPYDQTLSLPGGGNFNPAAIENAFDRTEIQIQQLAEAGTRVLTLPAPAVAGTSLVLPMPVASQLIGWNAAATALANIDPVTFAGLVAFGTARADTFTGDNVTTGFTLTANPTAIANIRVAVDGLVLTPTTDYTWVSGTTLTFTLAPATGAEILVQYMLALPQGVSDLTASIGQLDASRVDFLQTGTGAVLRTTRDKERDEVSVFDFMTAAQIADVKANTLTLDVTAAIQAALNTLPNGGEVFFPSGSYRISAALTVAGAGVSVRGKNHSTTYIRQYTANAKIFDSTTDFFGLSNMRLGYSPTPTAGATAVNCVGNFARLHNFYVENCYIGVSIATGVGGRVWSHDIRGYVSSAVLVSGTNDHFFSDFIYDALNATNGALGGIRLLNKAEAITFQNGDVLNGVYPMTTDGTYTAGNRPAYCNFTDVYFDSAVQAVQLDKMVLSTFVGCWWSGGRSGGGNAGLALLQTEALKFVNCEWFNCGAAGVTISASSKNTSFVNPSVYSNSTTAGAGVAHGMVFAANAHDFSIIGGACTNGLGGAGTQGNGIFIDTGTTNYSIIGVNVAGNVSLGIADASGVGFISKCPGFVTEGRGIASVIVGQTVVTVNHGLSVTPVSSDILVTPTTSPTASGVATWYVTSIGATTFQIAVNAAVATSNLSFAWQARTKGA